jgi:hypothetical protein
VKQHDIECGETTASHPGAIALALNGRGKNVNLRIDYISRRMVANIPTLLTDLLEIAAYVYCADQRLPRGTSHFANYGENWRRTLNFTIPVRHPEVWGQEQVLRLLTSTLGFLSDDSYSFTFRTMRASTRMTDAYFHDLVDSSREPDVVALFSGGIDSFAGAADDLILRGRAVSLVAHSSAPKVRHVQDQLVADLRRELCEEAHRLSFVPVIVTNTSATPVEFTQRSRSFLFACLGFVVARLSGKDRLTFYENGVVSINPPLAGDVIGGRATRTTHPRVLRGLEDLFSTLLQQSFTIETPLQWMTKPEVVGLMQQAGVAHLLARTNSCTRPRISSRSHTHCGACSQCIDRRFSVLAAGLAEHEPASSYRVDLLTADRSVDDDMRLAVSYVDFCKRVAATPRARFLTEFPELVAAVGCFPDRSPQQAEADLFDLLLRHVSAVEKVITSALHENAARAIRGELPAGSLLLMCLSRSVIEQAPPSDYDVQAKAMIDRLSAPILEFAMDPVNQKVVFRDGSSLDGANYRVVAELVGEFRSAKAEGRDVSFVPAAELANRIGTEEQSMRQQLTRIRTALDPLAVTLGLVLDQNSFIENRPRTGYRISPAVRELAFGDLVGAGPHAARQNDNVTGTPS